MLLVLKGVAVGRLLKWPAWGIVALSLLLNTLGLWYGLPYPRPPQWLPDDAQTRIWTHDTIGPVGPLAAARDKFSWGRWSQQDFVRPLAHYMLLAAAYSPYIGYLFLSGGFEAEPTPAYPYGLSDPTTALTVLTLISRAVSALMGTGIVLWVYLIAKELLGRGAALFSALIVALCNALIYFAHNTTLNVPYIFWSMGALYAYLRVLQQQAHWRWYVLLGAFAAVALATKDQAYGLVILLPMPILIVHWRRRASRHLTVRTLGGLLFERNLVLAGGSFLIAYALSNNLLFNFPRWILHINGISGYRVWDRYLDPSSIADHWRLFVLTMGYLVRSMGLPLFLLSLGGLVYCVARFPRRTWPLLVPLLSYYFLVIVGAFFYVHARHVMPLAFILGVFGGKAAIDLINSTAAPKWASYSLLALVLGYSLLYGSNADITLLNDSRHAAGLWMRENVPSNARVEVYDPPIWLPWFLNDYEVHLEEFSGDYAAGLRARRPDFVIVTERLYRGNADRVEAPCFLEASQSNPELRGLLSGELGYRLQAMFKFKLHDWFFPDMFYGQNPRILIFQRVSE